MKKIIMLSAVSMFTLSSFTIKDSKKDVVMVQKWIAMCGNGTIGGEFSCACSQAQANEIAGIMCANN